MKNLSKYIEEKLIINKDYKYDNELDNELLDIIKQIKGTNSDTDKHLDKYCIRNFLSCATSTHNIIQGLIDFTNEIFDASKKYAHKKFAIIINMVMTINMHNYNYLFKK